MRFFNENDVDDAYRKYRKSQGQPNLARAATTLYDLKTWANHNSDGWAYWPKPARAANKLAELIRAYDDRYRDTGERYDATAAELRSALSPVKAFLTRQGVDHSEVIA